MIFGEDGVPLGGHYIVIVIFVSWLRSGLEYIAMVSHIVLQEVEHLLFYPLWIDLSLIWRQLQVARLDDISLLPEALNESKNAIFAL